MNNISFSTVHCKVLRKLFRKFLDNKKPVRKRDSEQAVLILLAGQNDLPVQMDSEEIIAAVNRQENQDGNP